MPATLDDLRAAAEQRLNSKLEKLDARHREQLRVALKQYERVEAIPETVWLQIRREIEDETAAAILLIILAGDDWTTDDMERQGVEARHRGRTLTGAYGLEAGRRAIDMAAKTTDTIRDRLTRKVADARASGPGAVGELTDEGIDVALDDVYTPARRETVAVDQTTGGLSLGQRGAARRVGGAAGDGASTTAGQQVRIELRWVTERDNLVCPRCAPLDGSYEDVWGLVFPDGPGPEAHPNCRCSLQPVVIVGAREE